jgi:drug/metabolite transporter (DMT)-like permease
LFRAQLIAAYNPLFIVWTSHLICLTVTASIVWRHRTQIKKLTIKEWYVVVYLACAGGAIAMVLFTTAFAKTSNFTVPILIQKLQPLVALLLARWLLGEKPSKAFYPFAAFALFGAYLVSFELEAVRIGHEDTEAILYALAAAAIWGSTTVAGRYLSTNLNSHVLTSLRYVVATIFLTGWCAWEGSITAITQPHIMQDLLVFIPMALGPGLIALFIYYFGLRRATAASATFAELAFPVGTIVFNWIFLDVALAPLQILGALILLTCITQMGGIGDGALCPSHGHARGRDTGLRPR